MCRRDRFLLFHRGVAGPSAVIAFPLAVVTSFLAQGEAVPRIDPVDVRTYELGDVDGVPLGFTDATALPDGSIVFSSIAEDTTDAYRDGPCRGAAVGVIGGDGELRSVHRLDAPYKIEGVHAEAEGGTVRLLLVTDADDPGVPAVLFGADLGQLECGRDPQMCNLSTFCRVLRTVGWSTRRATMSMRFRSLWALPAALAAMTAGAQAPEPRMECNDGWQGWGNRSEHFCEIREMTVPATGSLTVEGGPNGGIRVIGSDRRDVLVRAMVQAWGDDEDEARETAQQIVVQTDGEIRAEGPERNGDRGWSVGYEIFTPRDTDLMLETRNGGIVIEAVRGDLGFETTNGGVKLDDLAGNVLGRTTNGGVDVTLTGSTWDGDGFDVRTTNGGVRLRVPSEYSARLEASTTNGGVHIDFPVTVQGRIGREISTTLGAGGPLVRVGTTNGGVHVDKY